MSPWRPAQAATDPWFLAWVVRHFQGQLRPTRGQIKAIETGDNTGDVPYYVVYGDDSQEHLAAAEVDQYSTIQWPSTPPKAPR